MHSIVHIQFLVADSVFPTYFFEPRIFSLDKAFF